MFSTSDPALASSRRSVAAVAVDVPTIMERPDMAAISENVRGFI
jgi:hypothetical protein